MFPEVCGEFKVVIEGQAWKSVHNYVERARSNVLYQSSGWRKTPVVPDTLSESTEFSLFQLRLYHQKRQHMREVPVRCIHMQQPIHKFGVLCFMFNGFLCCGHLHHQE